MEMIWSHEVNTHTPWLDAQPRPSFSKSKCCGYQFSLLESVDVPSVTIAVIFIVECNGHYLLTNTRHTGTDRISADVDD